MSSWKAAGWLTLLVMATGLPFVQRAYFVDDYYHMQMARGILFQPTRPYDFRTDDAGINVPGWERGHWPRMVNPPLFHYLMAGVMRVWGEEIWKLRTASLLFSLISLLCMYFLGSRFVSRPLAAASLLAVTPAYWLTSYSLLIDSALSAFFLSTLLLWVIALERRRVGWALAAGFVMGLTLLVKYFGVLVLPVAFAWQWMDPERRRWRFGYAAYACCFVLQLLWGLWNIVTYGQMHFLATLPRGGHSSSIGGLVFISLLLGSLYVSGQWRFGKTRVSKVLLLLSGASLVLVLGFARAGSLTTWIQSFYVDKIVVLGAFIGGTTVFIWFTIWSIDRDSWKAMAGIWTLMALLAIALQSKVGGFTGLQAFFLAGWLGITLFFLTRVSTTQGGTPAQKFLLVWIGLGLLELIGVMPWTAGRYLLLILPPMIWSFVTLVETSAGRRTWQAAWAGTALLGLFLAISDFQQANTIQGLASRLVSERPTFEKLAPHAFHRWYYLADTFDGSQPYLGPLGWENVFPNQTFKAGDLFLKARYRKSSWWTMANPERFKMVYAYEIKSKIPLRVMDVPASAGFYASCWGALPYAVTRHPLERFELYIVRDDG